MKKKYVLILVFSLIIFFLGKNVIILQLNNKNEYISNFKSKIHPNIKSFLKKTVFRNYALKNELESKNNEIIYLNNELKILHELNSGKIFFNKTLTSKNEKNFNLKKYFIPHPKLIYNSPTIKWNYIDDYEDKIVVAISSGKLFFFDKKNLFTENLNFKILKSNLHDFVKISHKKSFADTIKDILIEDKKIYVSFVREVTNNCYGNAILEASMNLNEINFDYLFKNDECIIDTRTNLYELNPNLNYGQLNQSGGRIAKVNNEIFFTIGNYRSWPIAQNKDSIFGKIIRINLENKKFKTLSMGHRNAQGLFYLLEKNLLFTSEHGPKGGDEINLIKLNGTEKIQNFGYPISSYGDHYDGKYRDEAPLFKSHSKYGFIEPIFYFKEGNIGPSEILINKNNSLILSSLKAQKLYFFKIDDEVNKLNIFNEIDIGERIRDIIEINEDSYLLSLENTPSIGFLENLN
tara:strand:- start:1624 stop:3009 length:1386 start_codon:yes stop_codon:yes gene_type:complete